MNEGRIHTPAYLNLQQRQRPVTARGAGARACGPCLAAAARAMSLERLQCRTMDPLSAPELTPVAWIAVLCNVKVPVVWAKRPVPPVMV
jgi:hypothetical protein